MSKKFDPSSFIGLFLGLVVILWGTIDLPSAKIEDNKKGPSILQRIMSKPIGSWDPEWKRMTTKWGQNKKLDKPGYLVTINAFWDVKSGFLVFAGVLAATFVSLPLASFGSVFRVAQVVFRDESYDYVGTINRIIERAEKSRKEGILSLESDLEQMSNPFFKKGIEYAINIKEPEGVRKKLADEKGAIEDRHAAGKEMFDHMASYAPAFGMMGTVMGLVVMMTSFGGENVTGEEISTTDKFAGLLGGMAMALITTFYGVVLSNLVFTPFANKLKRKSDDEMLHKNVITEGVVSIKSNEHPILIKEKLTLMVPTDVANVLHSENES
ncbi:MAG: motility protein A [Candidatus Neomarinimicrobiota bacterium]